MTKTEFKKLILQCIKEEIQSAGVNITDDPNVKKAEKDAAVKQQTVELEKQKALKKAEKDTREKRTSSTGDEKKTADAALKDISDKMSASKAALVAARQKARMK